MTDKDKSPDIPLGLRSQNAVDPMPFPKKSVISKQHLAEQERQKHTETRIISESDYRRIVDEVCRDCENPHQRYPQQRGVDNLIRWVARYEYIGMPDDYHETCEEGCENYATNLDAQIWVVLEDRLYDVPVFTQWRIDMKQHTLNGARAKHRKVVVPAPDKPLPRYDPFNAEAMERYKAFLYDSDKDQCYYKVLESVTQPIDWFSQTVIDLLAASFKTENVTVEAKQGALVLKPLYELSLDEGYKQVYYKYLEVPVCNCYDLRSCPKDCETCDVDGSIHKA
ncbi:MAG: hypothetical protein CVT67_02915 [Actinobacteria bacterium HGW-Actinobacteria-7]|jgi:hypothetical protein|nr:MAG: hypothetical protein CVT67_02915 [Actinobacteria bacterium HGW-Actinobacteria-7]